MLYAISTFTVFENEGQTEDLMWGVQLSQEEKGRMGEDFPCSGVKGLTNISAFS